jgi:predicted nucleic acid-binding protein
VIDANTMVSGVPNPHGPPRRIVNALLLETIIVSHDERILSESSEVCCGQLPVFRARMWNYYLTSLNWRKNR